MWRVEFYKRVITLAVAVWMTMEGLKIYLDPKRVVRISEEAAKSWIGRKLSIWKQCFTPSDQRVDLCEEGRCVMGEDVLWEKLPATSHGGQRSSRDSSSVTRQDLSRHGHHGRDQSDPSALANATTDLSRRVTSRGMQGALWRPLTVVRGRGDVRGLKEVRRASTNSKLISWGYISFGGAKKADVLWETMCYNVTTDLSHRVTSPRDVQGALWRPLTVVRGRGDVRGLKEVRRASTNSKLISWGYISFGGFWRFSCCTRDVGSNSEIRRYVMLSHVFTIFLLLLQYVEKHTHAYGGIVWEGMRGGYIWILLPSQTLLFCVSFAICAMYYIISCHYTPIYLQ